VLHMAQKIVSRQKHNMLSLLHAACLKLLVFFPLSLRVLDGLCLISYCDYHGRGSGSKSLWSTWV